MVEWLRRCPVTAKARVRFPVAPRCILVHVAVQFNGTDQGLSVGGARNQLRNLSAAAIACWARLESSPGATNRIIWKWSTATGGNTTRLSLSITTTFGVSIGCRILDADTLATHTSIFSTPPGIGEWHHYIVSIDYSIRTFYLYYDGALINTTLMTVPTAGNTSDTASLTAGIGIANPPTGNSFWPGSIDDMLMFNRLVGPAEAQTIYGSRGRAFLLNGITGCWQLAEGGEGVAVVQAADVSGLGGTASPVGAPVYTGGLTVKRRSRKHLGARA